MIYKYIITEPTATFYDSTPTVISVVNGQSELPHCPDAAYTGANMHGGMLKGLSDLGTRLDFRRRTDLLYQASGHYHGIKLEDILKHVRISLSEDSINSRVNILANLEVLFKLKAGAGITIFLETLGKTQLATARSLRRTTRTFMPFLTRLQESAYNFNILSPAYVLCSSVKNVEAVAIWPIRQQRRACQESTFSLASSVCSSFYS
jgi:hypothetical protein